MVIVDTGLRIVWANQAAGRLGDGMPAIAWPGRRLGEVLPGIDADLMERSLRRVLATGKPAIDLEVSSHAGGDPGGERFGSCTQFLVDGPDGEAAGAAHTMREVTGQVRNQRRLALADEASARIGTTLDITRTAEDLLDVAIPRLADFGAVDLLATVIDGDRHAPHAHDQKIRLQRVAVRWPANRPPPPEYLRHTWHETGPGQLYHRRLVAGLPIYLPAFGAMTAEQVRKMEESGTGFDRMMTARAAGAHSLMTVPLMARDVIMGIVVLYRLTGSAPFTAADLALARDFVSRAAVPVDNARLYTRERATTLALQRGLLPRHIPQVPGLQLAYRYVPAETAAETAAETGGDWFDVIPLPAGRCTLTVGDVTGHDISAASLMGQLRTATRTLATLDLTPADLLTRLDQVTADLTDAETSATCLYAACDPAAGDCAIGRPATPGPPWPAPATPPPSPACPPACPWAPAWPTALTRPPACTCPPPAPCCCTPTGSSKPPPPT